MYVVFDLEEPARMVEIAEPLFTGLKAKIDLAPAMSADDVRKGLSRIQWR